MTDNLIARLKAADDETVYDVMMEAVRHFHKDNGHAPMFEAVVFAARAIQDPRLLLGVAATFVKEGWIWTIAKNKDGYEAEIYIPCASLIQTRAQYPAVALTLACLEAETRDG